ncbi:MAG: SIS domain-containing protein, partial [Jiangellales bacterium]
VTVDANPAKELALVLADHVPLVWGGSPLASRAARRVAEQMRTATGMPAVAGTVRQIEPLLASAPEHDIFADPFDDADDSASGAAPPALVFLDDGDPTSRDGQERLEDAARARDVRTHAVVADTGPDVARFATLLAVGRFTAAYLAVGRAAA